MPLHGDVCRRPFSVGGILRRGSDDLAIINSVLAMEDEVPSGENGAHSQGRLHLRNHHPVFQGELKTILGPAHMYRLEFTELLSHDRLCRD